MVYRKTDRSTFLKRGKAGRPQTIFTTKNSEELQLITEEKTVPSLEEALNGSKSKEWKEAIKMELDTLPFGC